MILKVSKAQRQNLLYLNKSSASKWSIIKKNRLLLRNKSEFSDTTYSSPKKKNKPEPEEEFAHAIVKLPKINPEDKGPQIKYNDGLTNEYIDRIRKESTNRIKAKRK